MKSKVFFLFFIALGIVSMLTFSYGAIPALERAALIALYNSTKGDEWYENASWKHPPLAADGFALPGTENKWNGIEVSGDTVSEIHLMFDQMGNNLRGSIPPELGNLSNLKYLQLNNNILSGVIPPELGTLSKLTYLDLGSNRLSGDIPPELGNLSKLTYLDLSNNQLSGVIPPELGNLSQLTDLYLGNNQLSGAIPAELGNLSHLTYLKLVKNQLIGTIPAELGNLSKLARLSLDNNQLSGPIPPELGNLSDLPELFLYNNQLSGAIPPELGNLSKLTSLYLGNNQLSGAIPPELGNLSKLWGLDLNNNQLSGAIPPELGNLSKLWGLNLNNNQLSGTIPTELGNLSNLGYLSLVNNQLSGAIPPELGNLSNLWNLYLNNNQLSGPIPAELGKLSHLSYLSLVNNQLSGAIPTELGNLSNLGYLYLNNNQLSGAIPAELGNLSKLWDLDLSNNQISGSIPTQLGKLSWLTDLYLSNNQLSGSIPTQFGNLYSLRCLYLSNNQLSGPIPAELGKLSHLSNLYLNNNQLSGPIPTGLGNLSKLVYLYLNNNQLIGSIPTKFGNLYSLICLYLNNNQLSGPIPERLVNLHYLTFLNLSNNQLSGAIPSSFIELYNINRFDINYNCLYTNDSALRDWLNDLDPDWSSHQDQCANPPVINLNRSHLYFAATTTGTVTAPQTVVLKNTGGGTLVWTGSSNNSWLKISPKSGTGLRIIKVSINPSGLTVGTYNGIITVSALNAIKSPRTIPVTLKVHDDDNAAIPFGEFTTPLNFSTVSGSIPVTGWALDDIEVKKVEVFNGTDYIGDALFVEESRPDVECLYPDYPLNYKAGWGYVLLTNLLPDGGNGSYTLYAKATDAEGNQTPLGSKTFTCNNTQAMKPFGTLDTPIQGGRASGKNYINWGWVLTPQPNIIPVDGSTIGIWIDGVKIGQPNYNNYREDIAVLFPGYANSNGAAGYFYLDTTPYEDGIHTISWTAEDSAGNSSRIGSRYFSIINPGRASTSTINSDATDMFFTTLNDLEYFPDRSIAGGRILKITKEYGKDEQLCENELLPDINNGINRFTIKELEQIEMHFGEDISDIRGYMITGNQLRQLPIGSTLNKRSQIFYWSPGPGFFGTYDLVFLIKDTGGQCYKEIVEINIEAKFNGKEKLGIK